MKLKRASRKILQVLSTGGATLSVCFLSFVGMLAVAPSFYAFAAFLFVLGFEWQVNDEGNRNAFKSLFDPHLLKLATAEKYLDKVDKDQFANNIFFQNYHAKKSSFDSLKKEIIRLKKEREACLPFYEAKKRDELLERIRERKKIIKQDKKDLRQLKLFFLKKLYHPALPQSASKLEKSVNQLIGQQSNLLKKEMAGKAFFIRVSWLLSIMSGVCSGLSTLSAVHEGLKLFPALNFIPFEAIIGLSFFAGVGYTMLIQDTMARVVQKYKQGWIEHYQKKENETTLMLILRRMILIVSIILAIAATLFTAGTWFHLVKDGANKLGIIDPSVNTFRNILMIGMIPPNLVYNTENSLESVNKIFKMNFIKKITDIGRHIAFAWRHENVIQFCNIFRLTEKLLSFFGKAFFFLCHVTSIGAGSDRIKLDFIPWASRIKPGASILVVGGNELVTDGNYLPDLEGRRKQSFFLMLLFSGVDIPVFFLKFPSIGWDYLFSSEMDLTTSFEKIFQIRREELLLDPPEPMESELSIEWYDQRIVEFFNDTINRFEQENIIQRKLIYSEEKTAQKKEAAKNQKTDLERGLIDQEAAMNALSINRCWFTLWHHEQTTSQKKLEKVFEQHPVFSSRAMV